MRKINVSRALGDPTYYTNEDQISLSKYYPYEPISLVGGFVTNISKGGPAGSGYVPDTNLQTTGGTGSGLTVNITSSTGNIEIREFNYNVLPMEQRMPNIIQNMPFEDYINQITISTEVLAFSETIKEIIKNFMSHESMLIKSMKDIKNLSVGCEGRTLLLEKFIRNQIK